MHALIAHREDIIFSTSPRRGSDRVAGWLRMPETEAIMMLGDQDDVRGSLLRRSYRSKTEVECGWIEHAIAQHPAGDRVDSGVARHAKRSIPLIVQLVGCRQRYRQERLEVSSKSGSRLLHDGRFPHFFGIYHGFGFIAIGLMQPT